MELHFTLLYSTSNYFVEWLKQDIDQARQQVKSTSRGNATISDWFETTSAGDSATNARVISLVGSYFTISKYKPIQISAPLFTVNLQDENDGTYGSERVHVLISTYVDSEDLVLYLYRLLNMATKAWTHHKDLTESIASLAVKVIEIRAKQPSQTIVNTGGGAYVAGNVDTSGGNFIGRDSSLQNHTDD